MSTLPTSLGEIAFPGIEFDRRETMERERDPSLGQTLGAAINSEWTLAWAARMLADSTVRGELDESFDPFRDDVWSELTDGVDPSYWHELANTRNLRHAMSVSDSLRSVTKSRETLARAGVGGVVATLGAAILDPAIIAGAFGAGAMVAKAGRAASATQNFIRGGAAGLAVDVPAEAFLVSQDPDRGTSDILLAGLASFTLGGLGEAAVGGLANRAVRADRGSIEYVAGAAVPKGSRPKSVADSVRDATPEAKRAIRTRLEQIPGVTKDEVDAMMSSPDAVEAAMSHMSDGSPPVQVDSSKIAAIDFSRASDRAAWATSGRRSHIGFLADPRLEGTEDGHNLLFATNVLVGDPLHKRGGGLSTLSADEAASALRESKRAALHREFRLAFKGYIDALKQNGESVRPWERGRLRREFEQFVIEEYELGNIHGVSPDDKPGVAVKRAAEAVDNWFKGWVDDMEMSGLIDSDDAAALREPRPGGRRYFPLKLDGTRMSKLEASYGKKGVRAIEEMVTNARRAALGIDHATYRRGGDIEGALGTNFRFVLAGIVEVDGEDAARKFVSERLTQTGRFSTDEVAEIAALGAEPEALYEEWVKPYRGPRNFARMYTATAKDLGRLSEADKFRLFNGKQLAALEQALEDEFMHPDTVGELSDEALERVLSRMDESVSESEKGLPPELHGRALLDNYETFDASEILGETLEPMTLNDFADRDLWSVAERYNRSMSGSVVLTRAFEAINNRWGTNIRTVPQFLAEYENRLVKLKHDKNTGFGKSSFVRMKAMLNEIASRPHEQGQVSQVAGQHARIWRRFMNTVRNGSFSFAALPETGRILGYNGVRNTIRAVPMMREMHAIAKQGKLSNEMLDLTEFVHSTMTGGEFNPTWAMFDMDDHRSFRTGTRTDRAERGMASLERFSFVSSGFLAIERFFKRLNAAATANKFVNDAMRNRPWNASRLRAVGLSPEEGERIFKALRHEAERGKALWTEPSNYGHKVTKWRPDQFEDQGAVALLVQAMNKRTNRVHQTSTASQKLLIQNDQVASLMTQFMDFTIQGWEKHTLYAAQHWQDPEVYAATMFSTLFGSLVYIAQTHANAIGKGTADEYLDRAGMGEDWDEYRIFLAGLQRSGGLSILPQAADFVGAATGFGTPFNARSSGLTYDGAVLPGIESNPTLAWITDAKRFLYGVGGAIQGDDFSQQDMDATWRLAPLHRQMGVFQIQNSISSLLPPEER